MSKPSKERSLADNEAQAVGRMIRSSQYKLNLVANMIAGKKVDRAIADLTFSNKRIANDVLKILKSAVANAENNHNLDVDDLIVAKAWTGKDMVLKRFHARGRGKGARILKPFSELTIVLREEKQDKKAKKAKGKGKPASKKKPETAKKEAA